MHTPTCLHSPTIVSRLAEHDGEPFCVNLALMWTDCSMFSSRFAVHTFSTGGDGVPCLCESCCQSYLLIYLKRSKEI